MKEQNQTQELVRAPLRRKTVDYYFLEMGGDFIRETTSEGRPTEGDLIAAKAVADHLAFGIRYRIEMQEYCGKVTQAMADEALKRFAQMANLTV